MNDDEDMPPSPPPYNYDEIDFNLCDRFSPPPSQPDDFYKRFGLLPPPPPPPPRGNRSGRLIVYGIDDLGTAQKRDYILKGLVAPNEISVWVGAPKCGKSFLMLDIAYRLSLGLSVFKRRVKQTNVLYVAAEGEGGIGNRIKALVEKYGPSAGFHWIAQPADLLHQNGHLSDLIDAIHACDAGLVILDTLSRLMAGGDENSPADMGKFVSNVTMLRDATKAHVAVVHHGTKASNGTSPRGHSCLTGADDALIEVVKQEDGTRSASVVHAKDDADGDRFGFTLDRVELGTDDDGDLITTLIVEELDEAAQRKSANPTKIKSASEQIAMRCLDSALAKQGFKATVGEGPDRLVCYVKEWKAVFYLEGKPGASANTKRMAFNRALENLQADGRIGALGDLVWKIG